jgi:hypothetical protein
MEPDNQKLLELMQRRLEKLELLKSELLAGQDAFTQFNLEAAVQHVTEQRELCAALRRLDEVLTNLMREPVLVAQARKNRALTEAGVARSLSLEALSRGLDSDSAGRLQTILDRMEVLRLDLRRLTKTQDEFLRRSRRNTNVLLNLTLNCMGTYGPVNPASAHTSLAWTGA